MKKTTYIESLLLIFIGSVALTEAIRLRSALEPWQLSDVLGPAPYILFLGLVLIFLGFFHLYSHRHLLRESKEENTNNQKRGFRLITDTVKNLWQSKGFQIVLAFVLYILFLKYVGYVTGTVLFLLFTFHILGVRSWLKKMLLTTVVTTAYHFIFIKYCGMVLPKGFFF